MKNYKRVFLVDTLNIEDYSFINLMKLNSEDLVCLFKTDRSKKLDLSEMEGIIKSECKIQYIDLATNNYTNMSMFISFYLGRIHTQLCEECEIFIVSDTSNFEALIRLIEIPNRIIHLNKNELENIKEEIFYTEDEEVSIFPAFSKVSEVFRGDSAEEIKNNCDESPSMVTEEKVDE